MGVLGCVLCIVGSTAIVLHAPEEKTPTSVEQIWGFATQPGLVARFKVNLLRSRFFDLMRFVYSINDLARFIYFLLLVLPFPAFLLYTLSAIAVSLVLMLHYSPRFGQTNIMVYLGICSVIGSLTVMILFFR